MNNLKRYMLNGGPTLILEDPLPMLNINLSPLIPSDAQANPFQQRQGPAPEPKGDITELMNSIGVRFDPSILIWDTYNPHPDLAGAPPDIVFIGQGNGATEALASDDPASAGLQEVVAMFPGQVLSGRSECVRRCQHRRIGGTTSWYQRSSGVFRASAESQSASAAVAGVAFWPPGHGAAGAYDTAGE
jgi:hypothetical protein